MSKNLIDRLKEIPDFRTKDGRRHPLWLVLLFVIMATINGSIGNRACGDFVKRHEKALIEKFGIARHGVPSYSTIRRVMKGVDFKHLIEKFNSWAKSYVELEPEEWCGIDGKSIKGTVENHNSGEQNFVSMVSVFAGKRGLIIGASKFENKEKSEIEVVQELIQSLGLTGIVMTFDSLHCQKKLAN